MNKTPRYIRIALDIARRIDGNEFREGDKLRGRSTLASEYSVSPETIRRSAALLEDMGVVSVSQKSGIYVRSRGRALDFIEKFSQKDNINTIRSTLKALRIQKQEIEKKMEESIGALIEYSMQHDKVDLGVNYEIEIPAESSAVGRTISDLQFWHNTRATITAVRRGQEMFISPGPHFEFAQGDRVYFVSERENLSKVEEFIKDKYENAK